MDRLTDIKHAGVSPGTLIAAFCLTPTSSWVRIWHLPWLLRRLWLGCSCSQIIRQQCLYLCKPRQHLAYVLPFVFADLEFSWAHYIIRVKNVTLWQFGNKKIIFHKWAIYFPGRRGCVQRRLCASSSLRSRRASWLIRNCGSFFSAFFYFYLKNCCGGKYRDPPLRRLGLGRRKSHFVLLVY